MNQPPPNSPLQRIPSQFNIDLNNVVRNPPSNADSVPVHLKGWYSSKIFRTIMFFIFCFVVEGIISASLFIDKSDLQTWVQVTSSILVLLSPSPLDLIKNKKK